MPPTIECQLRPGLKSTLFCNSSDKTRCTTLWGSHQPWLNDFPEIVSLHNDWWHCHLRSLLGTWLNCLMCGFPHGGSGLVYTHSLWSYRPKLFPNTITMASHRTVRHRRHKTYLMYNLPQEERVVHSLSVCRLTDSSKLVSKISLINERSWRKCGTFIPIDQDQNIFYTLINIKLSNLMWPR